MVISISYSKLTGQLLSIVIAYISDSEGTYLLVQLTYLQVLAHVYVVRKHLILFAVYHWESMYWDQNLVTVTVDANAVIVVLILVIRSELHIYVF